MAIPTQNNQPSNSSRLSLGDDPLSVDATTITPPSTTPHLPKIEDIVRASVEYGRHPAQEESHHEDHDLEAMSLISGSSRGVEIDLGKSRQTGDEDEEETGFEAPTKTEKTLMITSISVVLLFSVAAGLTTYAATSFADRQVAARSNTTGHSSRDTSYGIIIAYPAHSENVSRALITPVLPPLKRKDDVVLFEDSRVHFQGTSINTNASLRKLRETARQRVGVTCRWFLGIGG